LPKRIKLPNGGDGLMDEDGHVTYGGTGHFASKGPEGFDPRIIHFDDEAGAGPPSQRLREQDVDGVDAELLFGGPGRYKDPEMAVAVTRAYNEYLAEEYCSYAPDRLFGVGYLVNRSVDQDVAEMERCAELGLKTVLISLYPGGTYYPTPEDDRFWAASIDLDMPITVHTSMAVRNYRPPRGEYLIKFPIEPDGYDRPPIDIIDRLARYGTRHCGSVELTQMIMTGVFDRFPKLKVFWAENQIGWIPEYLEQFDLIYEANKIWVERIHGLRPLTRRPSEYVREHAYWGFFDDPFGIRAARYDVGIDHILWGSDFPHEVSRWPHSQEVLAEQFANVPADEKQKILCENAVRLFHLDRA
jgi:predicted TIM-barrel fold metal-dependent hydrolase